MEAVDTIMLSNFSIHAAGGATSRTTWSFLISLTGHLLLFGVILFNPQWNRQADMFVPSVIDVQMVELTDAGAAPATKKATTTEKAPIEVEAPTKEAAPAAVPSPSEVKPEVSIAESKPEPKPQKKTALKYKTFKTKEVLKTALDKIENKVQKAPPKTLEDTIKRLKEKVAETEERASSSIPEIDENARSKSGTFAPGSKQEIEVIDLYRGEIAYRINANWAFSQQLADRSQKLMTSIVFKVMPDGSIEDIFYVDRSGNQYLDDSAMKAVMKSSPVMPHPKELGRPYVELGLRFTPEGVY